MSHLTLQRTTRTVDYTQGGLRIDGLTLELKTLELGWWPRADGKPGGEHYISCVPAGTYALALHDTAEHPRSFALVNPALGVTHEADPAYPDARTVCLLHVANDPRELEGCIGVGLTCGPGYVYESEAAYVQLQAAVPWVTGHTLTIIDPP